MVLSTVFVHRLVLAGAVWFWFVWFWFVWFWFVWFWFVWFWFVWFWFVWFWFVWFWFVCLCAGSRVLRFALCAGIRDSLACFTRRPCAGRHLLFFAAAKKSRQKKAAHTASTCSCLRAPKGSYASHGNHVTHVRCQRSEQAPHLLRTPVLAQAAANGTRRPGGKLCVGCRTAEVGALTRDTNRATESGVMRVRCESRHTVCHLGGGRLSGTT
ncbi:hypothetical protein C2L66_06905 [Paraburkholderia caribensis]|nr:hypothetical protein C2L66_06905 [Paraburkholderia caribensis]